MKMSEAEEIIKERPKGFMVSFEWRKGGILQSDYFPDYHNGEPLIPTENEAWELANKFAERTKGKTVNIYVTGNDFVPVKGYEEKIIKNSD